MSAALLDVARAAAHAGAHAILSARDGRGRLDRQGREIKIKADRLAHDAVLRVLADTPHPVHSEEGEPDPSVLERQEPIWIVDPLDGTANFERGIPMTAVSVALWLRGEPVVGAVYDFTHDEMFSAIAGEGAWCGADPIQVSGVERLEDAVICTGIPARPEIANAAAFVNVGLHRFLKVRQLGTAALALAYAASGRVDLYAEHGAGLWDVAAGLALIRGAGGTIVRRSLGLPMLEVVAGNARLVDQFIEAVTARLRERAS